MKIAIITYHYSNNKGAVMQTYALCRFLKENGHQVEIIDIRQDENANQHFLIKIIKNIIWNYRMKKDINKYYPKLSQRYHSVKELQENPPIADCYMVGSDQVWNPNISKDLFLAYFLDFGDKNIKRISYASSFGLTEWIIKDNNKNNHIASLLKQFNYLSVREFEGKKLAEKEFNVSPTIVLDPTFLNDSYPEFGKIQDNKEIVCYKLNKTNDFWNHINKVGEGLNLPILFLNHNFPKKGFKYCFPPSLKTWMKKMAGASFIVTDSFHGVAFSIINRKQFVVILNHNDRDSRLLTLIRTMHLEDRMYNSVKDMVNDQPWKKKIDYIKIEPFIKEESIKSRRFLLQSLS